MVVLLSCAPKWTPVATARTSRAHNVKSLHIRPSFGAFLPPYSLSLSLSQVSRSFAAVIQQLPKMLVTDVLIFYLVLRGLDTVEDDMTAFEDIQVCRVTISFPRLQHVTCARLQYMQHVQSLDYLAVFGTRGRAIF